MAPYNLIDVISHYQRKITRHQDDPTVLQHAIQKLSKVQGISISILQETGIGRVINGLKKHANQEVAKLAKDLVARWKDIVAEEEAGNEQKDNQSNSEAQTVQNENLTTTSKQEQSNGSSSKSQREKEKSESVRDQKDLGSSHGVESKNKEKKTSRSESDSLKSHHHTHKEKDKNHHSHHHKKSHKSVKNGSKEKEERKRGKGQQEHTSSSQKKVSSSSKSSSLERKKSSSSFAESLTNGDKLDKKQSKKPSTSSEQRREKERAEPSEVSKVHNPSIPEGISPHYKPLPPKKGEIDPTRRARPNDTTDEALSALIAMSKGKVGRRTAVYSGAKRTGYFGEVPTLYQMCIHVLQEYVDSIEECGNLPYDVLEPILERASPQTLTRIEGFNPYLMEDTAVLWKKFCEKNFPKEKRQELESWREMYERCLQEREEKLDRLKMKVKDSYQREKTEAKKAKLAYVGLNAKPPRNVIRAQAKNGTGLGVGTPMSAKRPGLATGPAPVSKKPKVAPMMAKTLKMARGMKAGFRR